MFPATTPQFQRHGTSGKNFTTPLCHAVTAVSGNFDLDLFRFGFFALGQMHPEHAVLELRVHFVGVRVVGNNKAPLKAAIPTPPDSALPAGKKLLRGPRRLWSTCSSGEQCSGISLASAARKKSHSADTFLAKAVNEANAESVNNPREITRRITSGF